MKKEPTYCRDRYREAVQSIGLLSAVAAWADGQIDSVALAGAVWAAVQTCFIRAGIDNSAKKAAE